MHIFLFVFVLREVKGSTQLLYCNMAERKFNRGEKDKYSLSEKDELGKDELCVKYKEEDDKIYHNLVCPSYHPLPPFINFFKSSYPKPSPPVY